MARINVLKTYKIFIGGKFPRTESGRYFGVRNDKGKLLANICLSSRKDFRNADVLGVCSLGLIRTRLPAEIACTKGRRASEVG